MVEVRGRALHCGLIQTRSCLEFACFARGVSIVGNKLYIYLGITQYRWCYLPYVPGTRCVSRVFNPFLKDCYSQTSFGKTESRGILAEACEVFVYEWEGIRTIDLTHTQRETAGDVLQGIRPSTRA